MKICKSCKVNKPLDAFGPHKKTADRHSTHCRPCDSKRQVEYQKRNPEKYKKLWMARGINRHGITVEEYEKLLSSQEGTCWICKDSPKDRRLDIDHDHKCCPGEYSCGKCIRGLLCTSCNKFVGLLESNKFKLSEIEAYLLKRVNSTPIVNSL